MLFDDRTTLGGPKSTFPATTWTLIMNSRITSDERAQLIINELCCKYWKPVYCYLRRKGYKNEDAKDLTQAFFQEIVLGRDLVSKADPSMGRFRTFLLTALERFLKDVHRFKTRSKRQPNSKIFQLDELDESKFIESKADFTPDQVFQWAWISELLNDVLSEVKQECLNSNMTTHWQVFLERLLNPVLNKTAVPSLTVICQKYDIDSESTASNMMITVKRRLRKALERRIRLHANSDSEAEREMSELMSVFTEHGAGS
jgi:RNA polymerase sigma-70 factor (ECF subfamily)